MRARPPLLFLLFLLPLLGGLGGCTNVTGPARTCPGTACPQDAGDADAAVFSRDAPGAAPGLVAAYSFDEASGTVVLDTSGNFHNAGLIGAVEWGPAGRAGGDAIFGGGYVLMPPGMLDGARELTFAAWVKVRTNDRIWQRIFDFNSGTGQYLFLTHRSGIGTLRFAITTYGFDYEEFIDAPSLPVNVWKHVAVVLGGAGAALYVDGAVVAANAMVTMRPANLGRLASSWLGRSAYSYDAPLDGEIDQVRIYTRALSGAEVSALAGGP